MQILYAYIIKSLIVSLLLVGYYWFVLRNNRFHQYNRFYLLASLVLSLLLPLVKFNWFVIEDSSAQSVKYVVDFMQSTGNEKIAIVNHQADFWIRYIYLIISLCIAGLTILGIYRIYSLKRKSIVRKIEDVDFMETEDAAAPFSFLKNIFWRKSIDLSSVDGQKIFKHELTHVKGHHSYDKLCCNLAISFFWINPVFWIIRNELNNIHEFIADEQAVDENEISELTRLLLEVHFDKKYFQSGQQFFHSSIKRRLHMFKKSKQIKFSHVKKWMVLPILLLTVSLFSFTISEHAAKEIDLSVKGLENKMTSFYFTEIDTVPSSKASKLPPPPAPPKSAALPAPPTPPKGASSPGLANKPKTGTLPAPPTPPQAATPANRADKQSFITIADSVPEADRVEMIRENGNETKYKPIILAGLNNGDAIVVWDGEQVYTDKIENLKKYDNRIATIDIMGPDKASSMFGYKGNEKITVIHLKKEIIVVGYPLKKSDIKAEEKVIKTQKMNEALIILEGKEISEKEMNKIDQTKIESMNVWKGDKAIEKYGKKGEHGVIEIKMKKQ
ncbi:MAG: M56 family metallopeptidase [Chitinophagaceae bacterium]